MLLAKGLGRCPLSTIRSAFQQFRVQLWRRGSDHIDFDRQDSYRLYLDRTLWPVKTRAVICAGKPVHSHVDKISTSSTKQVLYKGRWMRPIRALVRLKIFQLGGVAASAIPLATLFSEVCHKRQIAHGTWSISGWNWRAWISCFPLYKSLNTGDNWLKMRGKYWFLRHSVGRCIAIVSRCGRRSDCWVCSFSNITELLLPALCRRDHTSQSVVPGPPSAIFCFGLLG